MGTQITLMGLHTKVIVEASSLSENKSRKALVVRSFAGCETLSMILDLPFLLLMRSHGQNVKNCRLLISDR